MHLEVLEKFEWYCSFIIIRCASIFGDIIERISEILLLNSWCPRTLIELQYSEKKMGG